MAESKANGIEDEPMETEEEMLVSGADMTDAKFDSIIGCIEDIIMEDEFQILQRSFLDKHYEVFEDTEENKFVYSDIHTEYTCLIEQYLNKELTLRLPGFSMDEFTETLLEKGEELDGEVFEMLFLFTDFSTFKDMFLDYKAEKEGRGIDMSEGITITPLSK